MQCYYYYVLLPVSVCKCMYVSVIAFDIVVGNYCHCCSINFNATVINVADEVSPFLKRECYSTGRWQELNRSEFQSRPPVAILQIRNYNIHSFQLCVETIARKKSSYTSWTDTT